MGNINTFTFDMEIDRKSEIEWELKKIYSGETVYRPFTPETFEKVTNLLKEYKENYGLKSYTIIFKDTDGQLKESWHHLTMENIPYVKDKYQKQGKEILHFIPKTLNFGEFLKTVKGEHAE